MRNRNLRLLRTAALALALLPLLAESASAQLFRRGRRAPRTVERYEWSVPVEQPATVVSTAPTVTIRALLPTTEAELWVDGARKVRAGNTRIVEFVPKNAAGRSQYVVEALWSDRGQLIKDSRIVYGYPGDRITIDFTRPDPRRMTTEIVPKEVPGEK